MSSGSPCSTHPCVKQDKEGGGAHGPEQGRIPGCPPARCGIHLPSSAQRSLCAFTTIPLLHRVHHSHCDKARTGRKLCRLKSRDDWKLHGWLQHPLQQPLQSKEASGLQALARISKATCPPLANPAPAPQVLSTFKLNLLPCKPPQVISNLIQLGGGHEPTLAFLSPVVAGGAHGSTSGQLPGTRRPEALSEDARRVLMGCLTELHKTTSLYSMDELRRVPCLEAYRVCYTACQSRQGNPKLHDEGRHRSSLVHLWTLPGVMLLQAPSSRKTHSVHRACCAPAGHLDW